MFTAWYVAANEAAGTLLHVEGEREPAWLDGVGELELVTLGEVLRARYDPWVIHERDPTVLRVNRAFLAALAEVEDLEATASEWRQAAEALAGVPAADVAVTLAAMRECARAGLGGPGVLSVPAV